MNKEYNIPLGGREVIKEIGVGINQPCVVDFSSRSTTYHVTYTYADWGSQNAHSHSDTHDEFVYSKAADAVNGEIKIVDCCGEEQVLRFKAADPNFIILQLITQGTKKTRWNAPANKIS